jgi:hypothetical protein
MEQSRGEKVGKNKGWGGVRNDAKMGEYLTHLHLCWAKQEVGVAYPIPYVHHCGYGVF